MALRRSEASGHHFFVKVRAAAPPEVFGKVKGLAQMILAPHGWDSQPRQSAISRGRDAIQTALSIYHPTRGMPTSLQGYFSVLWPGSKPTATLFSHGKHWTNVGTVSR